MLEPSLVPDSQHRGLVSMLPQPFRDFAMLARFDRPIGWWLLFWPCVWGVLLAGGESRWSLIAWLLLGSIAMRGAGCVLNDIVDADLDRRVARTAQRPVASGRVSKGAAWTWLLMLCAVGLVVLFQLRPPAQLVALGSVGLVAAYPFMKRITWWPQAWLGMVFTWGALVGWIEIRSDHLEALAALYLGSIVWCIGYDTIYAIQDIEDDAIVGIRSSARRLGARVKGGVGGFYALALALWALAFWAMRPDWVALVALVPMALHLGFQVMTLDPADGENALARFRSNRDAGLVMALACWVVGNAGVI
ncbi:4-hydroxybenzoate octaprenyltransferase [Novosphingobium sp. 11B]|jgi:4-hydroxybenzoate polyprenyltransferase|uniref:4-hydroxybenzoate octaprenyltransferase n=1 Tax=Novosphingobium resinovorum TaxID=158500 RepID=A0A031JXY1_9SPHN|nr:MULTISPECIES: 4-hydroxybenzoate octaprenyltransferase [Sphingomonadaceae]EJU13721.1 4-hydroxybenzoate polyprenyltransferase [Sphingomonas sp. LH128]EZP81653.1 4-hydroxybenzoate polyprenyltransferase [Novosphingobium resinovorum]MEE4453754.1 4-hydroxybenzoate octaprenyltransferase [Novosphingobium resinovorum]